MSAGVNEQRADPSDFDFWEFVGCAVCHLPFSSSDRGAPLVPFWITECGHVVCNTHLNPNQSCAKCGNQSIQLMPLQRDMELPMSDWFRSLPHAIDGMANAVKFQQESLAALVRYYRGQCLQFSSTCDRIRNERRLLRKEVEALRREVHQLRQYRGFGIEEGQEPSAHLNLNGKRPMADVRGQSGSVKTNSSPRSIITPVGPLRLTRPPGEHPSFIRQEAPGLERTNAADRPGSSRFAEQYTYHGEDNSRMRPPQLTHEQSAPLRQARAVDTETKRTMAPPPAPTHQGGTFKPATGRVHSHTNQMTQGSTSQLPMAHNSGQQRIPKNPENMGPPLTPQRPFSRVLQTPSRTSTQGASLTLQSNRFIPSSSHGRGLSGPTSTSTSSAKIPAGGFSTGRSSGGQRMPFMPGSSNGFG